MRSLRFYWHTERAPFLFVLIEQLVWFLQVHDGLTMMLNASVGNRSLCLGAIQTHDAHKDEGADAAKGELLLPHRAMPKQGSESLLEFPLSLP